MLLRTLLSVTKHAAGTRIMPHYLVARDHGWLGALLDEYSLLAGSRRSEWRGQLRESLTQSCPKAKLKLALDTLDRLTRDVQASAVPPRQARQALFRAAASATGEVTRQSVLSCAAAELGVAPQALETALFADLPGERRIQALPDHADSNWLALESNFFLVSSLLMHSTCVDVSAWGNTRQLVRHARHSGLICLTRAAPPLASAQDVADFHEWPADGVQLEISGPFALFRHTRVYARTLSALVPRLVHCRKFELSAEIELGEGPTTELVVRSGDPIVALREPIQHDRRLEERFVSDFQRCAPDWNLIREPPPVSAGGWLLFADFELVHRDHPERRFLLQVVRFWTRPFLERKLELLREARLERMILCIDSRKSCAETELPPHRYVVHFQKRIDARAVLAMINLEG